MRSILVALLLAATPVASEPVNVMPYMASCIIQDQLYIEDNGPDSAVITYFNSDEDCSIPFTYHMVAPNGVGATIDLSVGGQDTDYKEYMKVVPDSEQMFSYPPEEYLNDNQTQKFYIMGGLS